MLGKQPLVIFGVVHDHTPCAMNFGWIDLESSFLASGFFNGGDHALRAVWRHGFVQRSYKGIHRNLGQIRRPLLKIGYYVFFVEPPGGFVIERPVEDHLLVGEDAQVANREVRVLAERRAPVDGSAAAV